MSTIRVVLIVGAIAACVVAWRLFADSVMAEANAPLFRVWGAHRHLRRCMFKARLRPEYYYRSGGLLFFRYPYSLRPRFRFLRAQAPESFVLGDLYPAQLFYISWWWPVVRKRECRVFVDAGNLIRLFDPKEMKPLGRTESKVLTPLEVRLLGSEIRTARPTSKVNWRLPK